MIIDAVELKRRYLLRIAGIRDKKVYIGPEVVDLFINDACNLSCKFCWNHAPGNPLHFEKAHHFSWEKFIRDVQDSVDLNVDQIVLVGVGEPTMHPLFQDMMRHLEQQPVKIRLYTNATFPLDYCLDVVRGDRVTINLGAIDQQQYLDLYGKDLFDRVIANIKRLVSLRDTSKPKLWIEISYVMNSMNISQKKKMQDLGAQLGVNGVHFKKMNVHGYNKEIALPLGSMLDLDREEQRTPPSCLSGWFIMQRYVDHYSTFCCRIPRMIPRNSDIESLKELWLSKRMMNMRLLGKHGHIQKMYKACQTCPFYSNNISRSNALAEMNNNA